MSCPECEAWVREHWWVLVGAAASVGIEHGRSTEDEMADYIRWRHQQHGS